MDLEPEEVEEERHDDQRNDAGSEVLAKLRKRQSALPTLDVHEIPQVNRNRNSDRKEGEDSDVFDGDDAAQVDASQ